MVITTRSSTKESTVQEESNDSMEVFEEENTTRFSYEEDDSKSVTLELIHHQIKLYRSELFNKIDNVKEDILIQMQNENQNLRSEILDLKDIISEQKVTIERLKSDLKEAQEKISNMVPMKEFVEVERDVIDLQQYHRRNNIEISGLPESITNIEESVIRIASAVNLSVKPSDIQACHRLKKKRNSKGPRNVIVRFVNRKFCESLLRSNKSFKKQSVYQKAGLDEKIYINNNLCNYNKFLWGKAKSLREKNLIHKFWCYNGTINVQVNDNDSAIRIKHIDDLVEIFPDEL